VTIFSIDGVLKSSEARLKCSISPRLDAEVLLADVLGKNRSYLRAWNDKILDDQTLAHYWALIEKRAQGVPIAYLTGRREFWSREFRVTSDVLIPRPETELIVELCLAHMAASDQSTSYRILDLGTGSGVIAITLGLEWVNACIIAVDKSQAALSVATRNSKQLGCENVQFVLSDWFSELDPQLNFDFIVSNPPYICEQDQHLTQGDIRFEPRSALVASDEGLNDIIKISTAASKRLANQGSLFLEHGYNQATSVHGILTSLGYQQVQTHFDLAGLPRVTSAKWSIL
jgi:release factor glutamine methyltransferase